MVDKQRLIGPDLARFFAFIGMSALELPGPVETVMRKITD